MHSKVNYLRPPYHEEKKLPMSMTTTFEVAPLAELREDLANALEREDERFAHLTAEHEDVKARILAALDALDAETTSAPSAPSTNGSAAALAHSNGAPVPPTATPPAALVDPTDVEVDLSGMTMEKALITIMSTKPGVDWRTDDLRKILVASGANGKASSVSTCLSIAYRSGKIAKTGTGLFRTK